MPLGASAKREREYKELKREFRREGRYRGREAEVAARIVNKQRTEFGETDDAKEADQRGRSPDRNLPIEDFDNLTVRQAARRLGRLTLSSVKKIRTYEKRHRARMTLLEAIERRLRAA